MEDANFEMLMFRPGLNASLRRDSEITFWGRPHFPFLWVVIALMCETFDRSL